MPFPIPEEKFARFLVAAKRATYASQDDLTQVKPALSGSHQLEFRQGSLFYRDIYYGGDFFIGQETVYLQNTPIWGMCYAGGLNDGIDLTETPGVYDFLGAALRAIPLHAPFRGPETLSHDEFTYINRILGTVNRFSGVETISYRDLPVYQLHYSGGAIRG
jgi:hypothetical protein